MSDIFPKTGSMLKRRYKVIDLIDQGGTAIILKCLDRSTNNLVAVKRFFPEKMTAKLEERIIEEPKLIIPGNYIVKGESSFKEKGFWHLVMPLIDGKTLRYKMDFSPPDLLHSVYYALCLAKCAADLHAALILSTDFKPENSIILTDGSLILIDITCFERIGFRPEVSKGTPPYAPKELLDCEKLSPGTDIFSIGVIFLELIVGSDELERITNNWEIDFLRGYKPDISFLKSSYPEAAEIISRTIDPVPEKRYPSASLLLKDLLNYYNSLAGFPDKKVTLILNSGKALCLRQGTTVIGRNEIDPANIYISDKHFVIDFDGTDIKIRDHNSRNKPIIRKTKIGQQWVHLKNNDVIQIANVFLMVRIS